MSEGNEPMRARGVETARPRLARVLGVALAAAAACASSHAGAEDAESRARDAYAQGARLHKQGNYRRAAEAFARADAEVPSDVAFAAALDAAMLADEPGLGMELVARARGRALDAKTTPRVETARSKFIARAGQLRIACLPKGSCLATLDGAPLPVELEQWVRAGQHTVVVQVAGETEQRLIVVGAGATTEATFSGKTARAASEGAPASAPATPPTPPGAAPSPTPPREDARKGGVSPAFFFAAGGLTVLAGAVATWSALDTRSLHDDFVAKRCGSFESDGCASLSREGTSARTRTNVLLAATGGLGVITAALGLVFVDWRPARARVGVTPNGVFALGSF